ncbi:MAG: Zn-dependent hydrolase [Eubacterium sp.]|jgi:glyoxylase-like metal-dependent hydrolase (beta-lactamase superfamily II)|nr:Zn-dependent hydrolase [Eubacterium sp.]
MQQRKINNRGVLFTFDMFDWDLNMYLILGKKYNFLIDTGLGSLCIEPVMEYIKNQSKPLFVINTHYHWDHIWGNSSLKNCSIIAHKLCRDMIEKEWEVMMRKNGRFCYGNAEICLPDIVFDAEIYFPDEQIRIIHTPGHTIDSISVLDEKDRILYAGDNIGDTMDDILPSLNCERDAYLCTLMKYKELDFDLCLSGHNGILQKDVLDVISSKI